MNLSGSIIKVVAYFDLFNYPVSKEEILFFLDQKVPGPELEFALEALVGDLRLFRHGEFYSLQHSDRSVEQRINSNRRAKPMLAIAARISAFLYRFPYVRGVSISGSLSKNCAAEEADIDFFIITRSNRLWIARTLMHLFKKWSFLTGRQHWYCMNYYLDEAAMEIKEKNIFTAIELATLLPVCGNGIWKSFFEANDWAGAYFPNHGLKKEPVATGAPALSSPLKKAVERILDNRFGDWLDNFLMQWTTSRWKQKELQGRLNRNGNLMSLRTGKHFSKPNPEVFQKKLLTRYHHKLKDLEARRTASLN
jgi:hypothetical protein